MTTNTPAPAQEAVLTAEQEIDAIMEQAQVFASAWAFLGGPFDNGSGLETAEREKANLRALLSKLRAPVADERAGDAAVLLEKYKKLCVEIGRGDSNHLARIDRAILANTYELRTAFNEWIEKTDFIQQLISSGKLPVKYLGWHRADVMRDLIEGKLASAPVAEEADQDEMERRGWVNVGYKHDLEKARRAISFCDIPGFDTMSLDNAIYWLRAKADDAAPQASEAVRPTDWQDALRVAELPEVDEALSNFANDCTQDNAVGLVQAILDAALKADKDGAQSTATRPESRASVESDGGALSAQPGAQKKCNCATCRPHSVEMRMILCEVCGDKRCPHAEDHRNACTAQHPDNKDGGAVYG